MTSIQPSWASSKSRFEKLELFTKVLNLIEGQYYREVDTEKLIQGAIKGMLGTLDPHSTFLHKDIFTKIHEDTKGEFGGIGIEVTAKDGMIVIITPIEDTPAFKVGLKAGDKIVRINHKSIIGFTLEEAVEKMKGKANTKVVIGVARNGVDGIKDYEITRKIIKTNSVKSALVKKNYIYIRLTQFQKRSAITVSETLKKLKKEAKAHGGAKGIIFDLRSNPGGLLEQAVDVSSIFMKEGVVVSTEGRNKKDVEVRYVKKTGHKEYDLPLAVLINGSSASASEIVAGALQDSKRAIVMGSRSFGKGSVQTVAKIDVEKGVKLTIAQYLTPLGRKIQAIGIKPDIELEMLDNNWFEEHRDDELAVIREKDLRNHLTATIETKEEKRLRELEESKQRERRIKSINARKKKKTKSKNNGIFKKHVPNEDYQVLQAINYLKTYQIVKDIKI